MATLRIVLILVTICVGFSNASAQGVILGILEDNQGHYAGDPNYRSVRVVFEKVGDEWRPFQDNCGDQKCLKTATSSYPREVRWTISFDGRNVGHLVSRTPDDFRWYSDVGQQEIQGTEPVPTIGTRSQEFGGYSGAVVSRPLIANSQPHFVDPDRWKPSTISPASMTALQSAFRQKFPKLCRLSEKGDSTLKPLAYRNEDVKLAKSYISRSGWTIARLHLEAIDCADLEAGFDINDPWFVLDKEKAITYLDSGMWLVDAGDYDNAGQSELIFSIDRDNEGGYQIYYDDFKKHATFKFNYH